MSSLQKDEVLYILLFKFPLLSEPVTKLVAPIEAETQHLPDDITSSHSTNTKSLTNSLQPNCFFKFLALLLHKISFEGHAGYGDSF
jgi:hypothetical protein